MVFPGFWGDWSEFEWCPHGGHAVQFKTKVEGSQGGDLIFTWGKEGDDTAMNGIELTCSRGGVIDGHVGPYGEWSEYTPYCKGGFTGAKVKVEDRQGSGDDTATNCIELYCSSSGTWMYGGCTGWGRWHGPQWCGRGKKICAVNTRLEWKQGRGDDTSLNNVEFKCC